MIGNNMNNMNLPIINAKNNERLLQYRRNAYECKTNFTEID